ncbi:MAG: LPS export ABC transporter ATP-binding protein [Planctomycetes bacterium]|nr:LPS export ABC transporter ATP-binding protein [Planctomycetota bacterium]
MTPQPLLRATGLRKSYRGRCVVDDAELSVGPGEIAGILGPNGAGKTTTFRMCVGLVKPDAGAIYFDGHDVTRLPMYRRARLGLGYLPQEASIFRRMTVEGNVLAVLETQRLTRRERLKRLAELLEFLHIAHLAKSSSEVLSGGERRRLEITRALASEPRMMLLDEPFAGVDPIAVQDIQGILRRLREEQGIAILITDHNVRETLGVTDHAYILHQGQILAHGTPAELVADARVREVYLGHSFA